MTVTFLPFSWDAPWIKFQVGYSHNGYGILSPTFYVSYMQGDEPPEIAWVADWNRWAATYEIWQERHEHYNALMTTLQKQDSIISLIAKAARREPIPVPA